MEGFVTSKRTRERVRRGLAAAGMTAAMLLLFASLAGLGFANGSTSASQYQYGHGQYGKKVTICHKGKVTITIAKAAWPAHKAHNDTEGPCAGAQTKVKAAKAAAVAAAKAAASASNSNAPGNSAFGKSHKK
jgi:hypothetical protein